MPWTEVDGSLVHYTPTEGSTATEAEVQEEIRVAINASAVERAARMLAMPTEQEAISAMFAAYQRLKELGWNDAIYCPKDGSSFDVIEPGSTGIHSAHYEGKWPKGTWWIAADGDLWPSRPILYRKTEAEIARWAALRERLREDGPSPRVAGSTTEPDERKDGAPPQPEAPGAQAPNEGAGR